MASSVRIRLLSSPRSLHRFCLVGRTRKRRLTASSPSSSSSRRTFSRYVSPEDDRGEAVQTSSPPPLVSLQGVELKYPYSSSSSPATLSSSLDRQNHHHHHHLVKIDDLTISHPSEGGHALLGLNGSGKSLISNAFVEGFQQHRRRQQQQTMGGGDKNDNSSSSNNKGSTSFFQKGQLTLSDEEVFWHAQAMAHVSFESHEELLSMRDDDDNKPLTVQKAITNGGNLNKAAQFLVVRFGMFPLLHRQVTTLSTGEIRKVLIIRALANRPRLLVLDNAFDGLDVPSRESLKDLVAKTLHGFRPDILVQAVDARTTAHTQIVLITHRSEEIADPITKVTYLVSNDREKKNSVGEGTTTTTTTEDRQERTGDQLLHQALALGDRQGDINAEEAEIKSSLPSVEAITNWWLQQRNTGQQQQQAQHRQTAIVSLDKLQIQRDDAILLDGLTWNVQPGQNWWIAGGNGSGKSTLSRFIARKETGMSQGRLQVQTTNNTTTDWTPDEMQIQVGDRRRGVGWVSTESHMALARSKLTTQQVLTQHYNTNKDDDDDDDSTSSSSSSSSSSLESAIQVLQWLDLPTDESFLERPFHQSSQGEQKLILIAAAISSQPQLLVLDEPAQGLDGRNRQRVLELVERLCQAAAASSSAMGPSSSSFSLVYITHHPEEVIPSISHVLHLATGKDVFQGKREEYDIEEVAAIAAAVE